jgi:hypothetical protein
MTEIRIASASRYPRRQGTTEPAQPKRGAYDITDISNGPLAGDRSSRLRSTRTKKGAYHG